VGRTETGERDVQPLAAARSQPKNQAGVQLTQEQGKNTTNKTMI
jgi:hypothetical protein